MTQSMMKLAETKPKRKLSSAPANSKAAPKVMGSGLIALDMVMNADPEAPIRSWTGGTCGNVLSILAYLGWDAYPIARMNGDPASERVRADMGRWGVKLDYASSGPTAHTPIIIQEIRRGRDGAPTHRFSWSCPRCGKWLPSFKAPTLAAAEAAGAGADDAAVFFFDRVSPAGLALARRAKENGALVVFEPSAKSDAKSFAAAMAVAHVVKYAEQRFSEAPGAMAKGAPTLVEIQTRGEKGLRYRHCLSGRVSAWATLPSIAAPQVVDSCGAGDWCTAGLVSKLGAGGAAGLKRAGVKGLVAALRYGQTLAAWNCGFEGARGGMYALANKAAFDKEIAAIASGKGFKAAARAAAPIDGAIACPACPPEEAPKRKSAPPRARGPAPRRSAKAPRAGARKRRA